MPILLKSFITTICGEVKTTKKLYRRLLVEDHSETIINGVKLKTFSTYPHNRLPIRIFDLPRSYHLRRIVVLPVRNFKESASPPITNLPIPSLPSVVPVSEEALASPDFTDFKVVRNRKKLKKDSPTKTNHSITKAEKIAKFYTTSCREIINPIQTKDNISTHQSALKPSVIAKPTSVDIELLPMAVLPPLEKSILQSRESDADAEMSSSSASDEDALEYNMSEDLEDSPAVIGPPPPSKPEKANKYKNR
ncbi:hypothetical protein AVEN_57103-1 [Araneus ventricosus]|uniref:Uncharacterized protein n=1 Tax=Araneus ventricosus TaxID=182803 RepID=A0A4Y2PE85_ARAVE|nr:hypothetical protein AVEN_57103-1 [Araneus ventricosus]